MQYLLKVNGSMVKWIFMQHIFMLCIFVRYSFIHLKPNVSAFSGHRSLFVRVSSSCIWFKVFLPTNIHVMFITCQTILIGKVLYIANLLVQQMDYILIYSNHLLIKIRYLRCSVFIIISTRENTKVRRRKTTKTKTRKYVVSCFVFVLSCFRLPV